jgi:hypothetical protein
MERADWLERGFDPAQARFLMVTAITHHRFTSPAWGADEVRKLHAELAEIDSAATEAVGGDSGAAGFLARGSGRHRARQGVL